jgi:hypothetical protein
MSSSLNWQPVNKKKNYLDCELKFILQDKFSLPNIFDHSDVAYLTGLKDAGVKGASDLINEIEKQGEVKVWESY